MPGRFRLRIVNGCLFLTTEVMLQTVIQGISSTRLSLLYPPVTLGNPNEIDPNAFLQFLYFADNTVSDIVISDGFVSEGVPPRRATMNQKGEAETQIASLPFSPSIPHGVRVIAEVTVENFVGAPESFNPTGLDLVVNMVQPAPEPSSLALFGIGGLALLGYGCRRRFNSVRLPSD